MAAPGQHKCLPSPRMPAPMTVMWRGFTRRCCPPVDDRRSIPPRRRRGEAARQLPSARKLPAETEGGSSAAAVERSTQAIALNRDVDRPRHTIVGVVEFALKAICRDAAKLGGLHDPAGRVSHKWRSWRNWIRPGAGSWPCSARSPCRPMATRQCRCRSMSLRGSTADRPQGPRSLLQPLPPRCRWFEAKSGRAC